MTSLLLRLASYSFILALLTVPLPAPGASTPQLLAGADVAVGFSPGNAESLVVAIINEARSSIQLAAYSFTSKPVARALIDAKKRGVKVFVVLDKSNRTAKYSAATFLANMRVPVRINSAYAIMHNKFMIVDGTIVETGSFNYTASAAKRNAENVIVLRGVPALAGRYAQEWRRLWDEAEDYSARY